MIKRIELKVRESFVFYRSFFDAIDEAQIAEQRDIYRAIVKFGLDGEEPDPDCLTNIGRAIWRMARPQLVANWRRYENGCRGGAPLGSRNNPNGRPRTNQKLTKNKPNVNDNVNDNDKVNENGVRGERHPQAPIFEEELKFNRWLSKEYPHLAKMEQPLTMEQWTTLRDTYGKDAVENVLTKMENWKPLTKKNRSAYRTAQNWLQRKEAK